MKILLLEPYLTGSHKAWAEGYRARSRHEVRLEGLEGRFWKWRMHGGAVTLARSFLESGFAPDLIVATDMLDLATFLSLTRRMTASIPVLAYFHENQLSYPWAPSDRDVRLGRDRHYGFINLTSCLVSDHVCFNSAYHRDSFLRAADLLLRHFPDHQERWTVEAVAARSSVLPLGLDLAALDRCRPEPAEGRGRLPPLLLWNHRWEYDKNPAGFFDALRAVAGRGIDFRLAVLGENFRRRPAEFDAARRWLGERIAAWGFARSFAEYAHWLWQSDILPVTSNQEFFGIACVEAAYCGVVPLLPRRLAYPELVPPGFEAQILYDSQEELIERLSAMLTDGIRLESGEVRRWMARFDWERMAPYIDREFERAAGMRIDPERGSCL